MSKTAAKRRRTQRISRSQQADELLPCRQLGATDLLVAAVAADDMHPLARYFAYARENGGPSVEDFARWHSLNCARHAPTSWPPVPPELERLGPKSVQLLLADPPWPYLANGGGTLPGMVEQHYETPDMRNLYDFVNAWLEPYLADDCVLLMWATGPRAHAALGLVSAWRFDYKNKLLYWLKTYRDGRPALGLGRYTRTCAEELLLATRGDARKYLDEVRSRRATAGFRVFGFARVRGGSRGSAGLGSAGLRQTGLGGAENGALTEAFFRRKKESIPCRSSRQKIARSCPRLAHPSTKQLRTARSPPSFEKPWSGCFPARRCASSSLRGNASRCDSPRKVM